MNEVNWIKNLKVGDKVYQKENKFKWVAEVLNVNDFYVETSFFRDHTNKELLELCEGLAPYHRTFTKQFIKNYFGLDGSIDIEEVK